MSNTSMDTLNLKKLDITSLFNRGRTPTIIIIGRRSKGKTTLIADILNNYKDVCGNGGDIVCGDSNSYSAFRADPSVIMHNEYTPRIIETVFIKKKTTVQSQTAALQEYKDNEDACHLLQKDAANSFLVLDNCLYDATYFRDRMLHRIFMNGFIWKIMLLLSIDYPVLISPVFQHNATHTFIFPDHDLSYRRHCWEKYANILPSFKIYCDIVDSLQEHECLVIVRTVDASATLDTQVFLYKSPR